MKGIIIYKGRYGATRQYAEWLGETLKVPAYATEIAPVEMDVYDYVIIGTSVYIGKLEIRSWLKKNLHTLQSKKVFFFQVSGTPPHETEKLEGYLRSAVPDELRKKIDVFFLPGRLDIKRLSWFDRFMLRMGARLTKDPDDKKNMLTEYDHVKRENLSGIVEKVKAFVTQRTP